MEPREPLQSRKVVFAAPTLRVLRLRWGWEGSKWESFVPCWGIGQSPSLGPGRCCELQEPGCWGPTLGGCLC